MSNPLTLGREACWDAIDNWPALNPADVSVFNLKLRFEDADETPADFVPAVTDLPCISITPVDMTTAWDTNRMQEWSYQLGIVIYVGLELEALEQLVMDVIDALYQAHPENSSVPYVKAATGQTPKRAGRLQFARVRVGTGEGIPAIRVTLPIVLRLNHDPLG